MVVCQLQLEYGNRSQLPMLQPKRPQAAQIAVKSTFQVQYYHNPNPDEQQSTYHLPYQKSTTCKIGNKEHYFAAGDRNTQDSVHGGHF